MIVGVVGGRDFKDWPVMKAVLDTVNEKYGITMIVSGGAKGADYYAYNYAVKTGITFVCHPPLRQDLLDYGFSRSAKRRNLRIVEHCDMLIAFPTEESRGTWHSVGLAKKLKKSYRVITPDIYEEDQ